MKPKRNPCDHTCPRDCDLLNEALQKEEELLRFYTTIQLQCERVDMRLFVANILKDRTHVVNELEERINAMYSTFDPAGC